ncbi:acetyl-CoA carboxylase, biotin carboxyl carrier protein [Pseudomonas brassicacearum]|uniref:acetyl-CoA carboxylase biotin carboxyl carrier protein n=1 Tax=Pseudomonas brassicacearum TaxID=930166 RepID=UPI000F48EEC4|nr:acetyl-CoA carboxylase biotin carboxyl carrier protein [Pseudomonas brassicacearum]ROM82822.1 acetyl-CoA carboxylase, biotin carboxyl carrier protein [Pseudomonas brassicacearum]
MNIEFIERLIEIVARSEVAELEYSEGDCRIRLGQRSLTNDVQSQRDMAAATVAASDALKQDVSVAAPTVSFNKPGYPVSSSLVGVFYRSASPDKPPFVEVGDVVEEGQTLAIVEAMKMLNPIEADRSGRIIEILKNDGEMIEAGSPLFTIEAMDDHE